jgi:hypothetical protein
VVSSCRVEALRHVSGLQLIIDTLAVLAPFSDNTIELWL